MDTIMKGYEFDNWVEVLLERMHCDPQASPKLRQAADHMKRMLELYQNSTLARSQPDNRSMDMDRMCCLAAYVIWMDTRSPDDRWSLVREDLIEPDRQTVITVMNLYTEDVRAHWDTTMLRIVLLTVKHQWTPEMEEELHNELMSLKRYLFLEMEGKPSSVSLNYNQLSELGLVYRINKEILHPLGMALHYNAQDGISEGVYLSSDRVYEYTEESTKEMEPKYAAFIKNRRAVLDKLELQVSNQQ